MERALQEAVWEYYGANGRHDLPWRAAESDGTFDPYKILVSELMLQQTQVGRVVPKYLAFIRQFPSLQVLAEAPLASVLQAWSGLGYNRRAKFLWQAAQNVAQTRSGQLPSTADALVKLPGIGPNTAGAILAYAFNQRVVFIETNIRTVFIYHFFADQDQVSDEQLREVVRAALPAEEEAREWYWALMDYGTHLKQTIGNVSRSSATYAKQSTFQGSRRQLRGQVLQLLGRGPLDLPAMRTWHSDERLPEVVQDLLAEGFIHLREDQYHLGNA